MRSMQEITRKIKEIEKSYDHVLKGSLATVEENAPRALMQLSAKNLLSGLYFALGKPCPRYEYETGK